MFLFSSFSYGDSLVCRSLMFDHLCSVCVTEQVLFCCIFADKSWMHTPDALAKHYIPYNAKVSAKHFSYRTDK